MLETIYVGMTGLLGYSRGLRVIANNTANLNTPGFKSSTLQFADMFYTGSGTQGDLGHGLNTLGTTLSFKAGELRQSTSALDLAVDGQGLFVLKGEDGSLSYSRSGQFEFDDSGVLVAKGTKQKVQGLDAQGHASDITLTDHRTIKATPTSTVTFTGNLSFSATQQTVGGVKLIDASGGEHTLDVKFTNDGATQPGQWKVEVLDGTTSVGTGTILFTDGAPDATQSKVDFTYTPAGQAAQAVTLDFSTNVTSYSSGSLSTLAMNKQNGLVPGSLTDVTFDTTGTVIFTYSNGQTVKGVQVALAKFDSMQDVRASGDNQFVAVDGRGWQIGVAGAGGFGAIKGSMVEMSNVDLSQEFSDLVVMQRGYQASSQIVSTANEMLQELFSMKK